MSGGVLSCHRLGSVVKVLFCFLGVDAEEGGLYTSLGYPCGG